MPQNAPIAANFPSIDNTELATLRHEMACLQGETRALRRRASIALIGLGLTVVGGLIAMTNPEVTAVIQTKRLEIVDDQGRVTVVASTSPQGGRVDVWNANGANVARLGSNDLGGDFILWNRDGKAAFSAYAQQNGGRVELGSSNGTVATMMESALEGGRVTLANTAGNPLFGAGAFAAGGALRIGDRDNNDAAVLQATSAGGSLGMSSPDGTIMARMRAGAEGGEFDLAAKSGGTRVSASVTDSESVIIAISPTGSGKIEADKDGGKIDVLNDKGDRLASLESNEGGGLMVCRAGGARPVASLGSSGTGGKGGLLQVYNGEQNPVFAAAVNAQGAGRLALGTQAGVATIVAESGQEDGGSFSLIRGGKRSIAFVSGSNGGLLNLFSLTGVPIIALGGAMDAANGTVDSSGTTSESAGGAVVLRSSEGKDLVRMGVDEKGGGNVVLFNKDATERKSIAPPR